MRLVLLLAGVLAAVPVTTVRADQDTVRIASWNLRGMLPDLVRGRLVEPKSVWRHTFGPRQPARHPVQLRPVVFEADIVALQGISSPALAKRLFPAQKYLLIVSRRPASRSSARAAAAAPDARLTAIAVRRRRHVRIVGREYITQFATGTTADRPGQRQSTGIAVKVRLHDRAVWVLSIDLIDGCRQGPDGAKANMDACQIQDRQFHTLARWLDKRRQRKAAAIVAGSLNRTFGLAAPGANTETLWRRLDGGRADAPRVQVPARSPQTKQPEPSEINPPPARLETGSKPASSARPVPPVDQGWLRGLLDRIIGKPAPAPTKAKPHNLQPSPPSTEEKSHAKTTLPKSSPPKTFVGHRLVRFPANPDMTNCSHVSARTLDYILVGLPAGRHRHVDITGQVLTVTRTTANPGSIGKTRKSGRMRTGACPLLVQVPRAALPQIKVYRPAPFVPRDDLIDLLRPDRQF